MSQNSDMDIDDKLNEFPLFIKTEEEIDQYTVDESISDVERANLYLQSRNSIQVTCLINSLPKLAQTHLDLTVGEWVPRLLLMLPDEGYDVILAFSEVVNQLLQEKRFDESFVSYQLLPVIIQMLKSPEETVVDAYLQTLTEAIPFISDTILNKELVSIASQKADVSETVHSRISACRLYGELAKALSPSFITDSFYQRALWLCQDTDFEVRICMCQQLLPLGKAMGPEKTVSILLPELRGLLNDEENEVRVAAFEALVQLLPHLDRKTRATTIVSLLKSYCRSTPEDMVKVVATTFGEMLLQIWGDLDEEEDVPIFLEFYRGLAEKSDVELRRLCAYNFPGVLKTMGPRKYALHLHTVFTTLAEDASPVVRRLVAACLHEVATILGKERAVKYLKDMFIRLLRDSQVPVQETLVSHVDIILSQFYASNADQRSAAYTEILPHLLNLSNVLSSWRNQVDLINQFAHASKYFSSEQIFEYILPLQFRYMINGSRIVKKEAALVASICLRSLRSRARRDEICSRIISDFARAQSFWHRMLFIDIIKQMLTVFSRTFVKTNFFFIALELAKDPVANVRLKVCSLLPDLKKLVKLPKDQVALDRLVSVTLDLTTDRDADVNRAATLAQQQLNAIRARMEGMQQKSETEEDIEDRNREEEERKLLSNDDMDSPDQARTHEKGPDRRLGVYHKAVLTSTTTATNGTRTTVPPRTNGGSTNSTVPARPSTQQSTGSTTQSAATATASASSSSSRTSTTSSTTTATGPGSSGSSSSSTTGTGRRTTGTGSSSSAKSTRTTPKSTIAKSTTGAGTATAKARTATTSTTTGRPAVSRSKVPTNSSSSSSSSSTATKTVRR